MRRALPALAALTGLLAAAGIAAAIELRAGDLIIHADGGFSPTSLPRDRDAPITLHGGGRLSTVSGQLPPVIRSLDLEFDRHGHLETAGLPVCTRRKLEATTVAGARHQCPGAIVGRGRGRAMVSLPEQPPFGVGSPITLFNGPRRGGNATVIAHAYTTVPVPTTYVLSVVIERIHRGAFGYRTKARIPRVAGGYGTPVAGYLKVGRRWTYRGRRHSYLNARCQTGRLLARGKFAFQGGIVLRGNFFKPCSVRR